MMTANGLAKLLEELGELSQVAAKKISYPNTDDHPDGGLPFSLRLEQEMGNVLAAIDFVIATHELSELNINMRRLEQLRTYHRWHNDPENQPHTPP